ncbi:4-hydroxy-3-methylbut-2-enyl diphosphate reductase [Desulfovulcanus sp.]
MTKKIILAQTAGFCMGVSLALRKLDEALEKHRGQNIYTLGPIIHNPQVLGKYASLGVNIIEDIDQPQPQDVVIIRAHGIPLETENILRKRQVQIIDATCPKVKRAQLLIQKHSSASTHLLLYGEPDHPEVRGLLSYARGKTYVFDNLENLQKLNLDPNEHYFLAAQTTQDRKQFYAIKQFVQKKIDPRLDVLDTICDATKNRQEEAVQIARQVDFMIVVGGKNSGNTRRLAKVAQDQGTTCVHIETKEELPFPELAKHSKIGLTAGASTPDFIIQEVYNVLKNLA